MELTVGKATRSRVVAKLTIAASALSLAAAPASATVYEMGTDGIVRDCSVGPRDTRGCLASEDGALPAEQAPDVPALAITMIAEPLVPPDYRAPLIDASARYGVSPRLLAALTRQESAWRASVVSPKGAIGLTQLMPATARALAVDPRDPAANLNGGARYLRQLLDQFDGDIERALAAYNAGPGRVVRARGIPAISETRAYVASIVDRLGIVAAGEGGR
ncbi:MAG: lytic transglycosylase domain-containing protein [Sphingomicrobium sp.]